MTFADFLRAQFGTETLAEYGWFFGRATERRRAQGRERHLRAPHARRGRDHRAARHRHQALQAARRVQLHPDLQARRRREGGRLDRSRRSIKLADLFENRRQYETVGGLLAQEHRARRSARVEAEAARPDRGQLGPVRADRHAAGRPGGATVEFRFRNGKKVSFEAQEINVQKLLDDVKAYLKDPPKQLDWNEMNIADIGCAARPARTRRSTSSSRWRRGTWT